MKLRALPAFSDNYIWMLDDGAHAIVVDPGEASPVLNVLSSERISLRTILVTHHHPDHVGGVAQLREATGARVFGPAREQMPQPCEGVSEGMHVDALGLAWQVLEVPGHTAGHVAYFARPKRQAPVLFCGDTLFSAGCGRLFEGTAAQMLSSLDRLATLPEDTRVCCAHEYTLSNLRFALAVEPDNPALRAYSGHCETLRTQGLPTLPSSVAQERAINPFLRWREPAVRAAAIRRDPSAAGDVAVFAAIRQWKNEFK